FPYTIEGNATFRPLRVWSNGVKTFFLFSPGFQNYQAGSPVLEAITGGCGLCIFSSVPTAVLNARWSGDFLTYDGVIDHAELIAGGERIRVDRYGAN
ncbi:MAG TPA: TrbG/VirB9 family P-type conjugative transfer protein, partial [Stellaceae bacterium]|nr:TrbG/VirB9 family P-type conjugative transfer protein [Stellaceae bacterium]